MGRRPEAGAAIEPFADHLRGHAYSATTRKIYLAFVRRFAAWLDREGRPALPIASAADALVFTETLPETSRRPFRNALEAYWTAIGRDPAELTEELNAGARPTGKPPARAVRARERLERWLVLRGYSRRTARLYGGFIFRLEWWLADNDRPPLNRCSTEDVLEFAMGLPNTYASRMQLKSAVAAYWRGPLGQQRRPSPLEDLRCPPRPEMHSTALETDQISALLDAARDMGPDVHAATALMYYAALRREEAASLEWSAIRADGWLDVRGKGAKDGRVPIVPELHAALEAQRRVVVRRPVPSRWVFPGRQPHVHISPNTLNTWLLIVGAAAGLGHVRPHQLRHSAGATMHDATGDLRATARFLRHSMQSLSITSGYTRTTARRLVEMAETLTPEGKPRLRVVREPRGQSTGDSAEETT